MADAAIEHLIESIDIAKDRSLALHQCEEAFNQCEQQVKESANACREKIQSYFKSLRASFEVVLRLKEDFLLAEVGRLEENGIVPIQTFQKDIARSIQELKDFLSEGKSLLMNDPEENVKNLEDYTKKVQQVTKGSVPTPPEPHDVTCIQMELPQGLEIELQKALDEYSHLFNKPPVRFSQWTGRPGGVSLTWEEVNEDGNFDLTEFKVQFSLGVRKWNERDIIKDAYEGIGCTCIIRGLTPGEWYSVRVCGRTQGSATWSPWSVPVPVKTLLEPYAWKKGVDNFKVSNDGHTAETSSNEVGILHSSGPSLHYGHSLVVKIVNCPTSHRHSSSCGIFLSTHHLGTDLNIASKDVLAVTTSGKILMDGEEKTTKFPLLVTGTILTFTSSVTAENKLRVTIEMNDYSVTFDWLVIRSEQVPVGLLNAAIMGLGAGDSQQQENVLFFGAVLSDLGWQLSVE